jgi:hypothetical protein
MRSSLIIAFLALFASTVSAAEVILPVTQGITSQGNGLVGVEVGMYTVGVNSVVAGSPSKPVTVLVQQSANFRNTVEARFPQQVAPASSGNVQAFQVASGASTTYAPSGHYVANEFANTVFGSNSLSSYPTPDQWYANTNSYLRSSGGANTPIYSSTLADVKQQHYAAWNTQVTGNAAINSAADVCVPFLEPDCRAATGISSYSAPDVLSDTLNLPYHAMLVLHKDKGGSWGNYLYIWYYPNSCDDGTTPSSGVQCTGAGTPVPQYFQNAASGWAAAGTPNYETSTPKGTFAEYALMVETGIYHYAIQNSACTSISSPTTAQIDSCVNSAYGVKPSTTWTYDATTSKACVVTGFFSSNQCTTLKQVSTYSAVCPSGYTSDTTSTTPQSCTLTNSADVITEPGWGCRVYRTGSVYSMEMRDPDCSYAKGSVSFSTGKLEIQYGSFVAKFKSVDGYVDSATGVSYPPSTTVQSAYPFARGQVITDILVVSNTSNKILSYSTSNVFGPPPSIDGTRGAGLGADGGTIGGVTLGGGTLAPGYGCTVNCGATGSGSPYGSNPSGSTASPGDSITKADPSASGKAPTSSEVAPDGLPESLKGIGSTEGLQLVQSCPPDAFKFHVGNFLGRDFTLWDQGVFCSVVTPYESLVRAVSTALVWFAALFVVISA